jgi:membrane peptidoglycan carboxypeptidase
MPVLSGRRWGLAVVLTLTVCCVLLGSTTYTYLQLGWFESARLGQTLHLRRIHEEGLYYKTKRAWGVFPRAQGLLHDPFTHNAWKITSVDGYTLYHKPPTWWAVPLSQIPPKVHQVFLFREDRRFSQHTGVDPRALLRAVVKTLIGHKQGGSTIAMQVAKHCLLDYGETPASTGLRGIIRKVREMLLALRLVKVEGRDKVLEYHLNHATMGPGLQGIGPAAWDFFRKKPHELSVGEAAQIAVLLPSPSRDPRHPQHWTRYEKERATLLQQMYEAGVIDTPTYQQALYPPALHPPTHHEADIVSPQSVAAAFRVIDQSLGRFGLRYSPQQLRQQQPFPLHVRVSLHAQLSRRFYQAMAPVLEMPELRYTAILLLDGRPLVLLGGNLDLYHYAIQARRQVGSVSKLFFYDAVWQLGYMHPDTIVEDGDMPAQLRQRFGRPLYYPRNNDGRLRAPLPHHRSLSESVNKIAYRTTWGGRTNKQRSAIAKLLVDRFGFPWHHVTRRSLRHFYKTFTADESVALGTWLATPFEVAAMLEKGFRGAVLSADLLILSWNGNHTSSSATASIPGLSQPLLSALQDAVAATAPQAVLRDSSMRLAAKTGTTNGGRDAWFVGFVLPVQHTRQANIQPRITFVAWAGYDDNRPAGLYGGVGACTGRFSATFSKIRASRRYCTPYYTTNPSLSWRVYQPT